MTDTTDEKIREAVQKCITRQVVGWTGPLSEASERFITALREAGYTIAPLPENLSDERINAALEEQVEAYSQVGNQRIELGQAFLRTYAVALGIEPPQDAGKERE